MTTEHATEKTQGVLPKDPALPLEEADIPNHFCEPYRSLLQNGLKTFFKDEKPKVFPVYKRKKNVNSLPYVTFVIVTENTGEPEFPYFLHLTDLFWDGTADGDGTCYESLEAIQTLIQQCLQDGSLLPIPQPPPMTPAKIALKELLQTALTTGGPFKLASGHMSDTLMDLSKVLRTQKGQDLLTQVLAEAQLGPFDSLGGPISGSDLVAMAACRAGLAPHWFGVRKEPKGRGYDENTITGNLQTGNNILVLEDICTSGGNLLRCIPQILEKGVNIQHILAVVDRGGLSFVEENTQIPTQALFTLKEIQTA